MQKDLLTELHLPKIGVKCLEEVVKQNSVRLIKLIKENQDFIKKTKIVPPGYKGYTVSGFPGSNIPVTSTAEKVDEVNGGLISPRSNFRDNKEMGVDSNHDVGQFLENSSSPRPTVGPGCVTLASNLGWGSEDEENEVTEIRSYPIRCNLKTATPLPWDFNLTPDKSPEPEITIYGGTEFMCHSNSTAECEDKTETPIAEVNGGENLDEDPLPIGSNCEPRRCYSRKKSRPTPAEEVFLTEEKNSVEVESKNEENSENALCVISEVIGNADSTFSSGNPEGSIVESQDPQLITPKKTNDITKIKGWRRKQFFVEKPTTVEFYSYANGCSGRKRIKLSEFGKEEKEEPPGKVENAFVCDSLDDFLDRESELKIDYEIPHLYAEFGIKLTSKEIVSKPNLSHEDFKNVETRYCVPVSLEDLDTNVDLLPEVNKTPKIENKKVNKSIEDNPETSKMVKLDEYKKRSDRIVQKLPDKPKIRLKNQLSLLKSSQESGMNLNSVPKISTPSGENVSFTSKLIGLVVYPGPFKPLHSLVQYHLLKLRSYRTEIDQNWANFAASAVVTKSKHCRRRILPVHCCGKIFESPKAAEEKDVKDVINYLLDSVCDKSAVKPRNERTAVKQSVGRVSLLRKINRDFHIKECSVVIDKIKSTGEKTGLWCMEHNCYNCTPCGLTNAKLDPKMGPRRRSSSKDVEMLETPSSQASIDKQVVALLARKLRNLRVNGDTLTSIDSLKSVTPNAVEFIKLNFVKQSFLTGYINIWYLKPENSSVRSRAFLTFSQTPPVPNAVNLKSSVFSTESLPKVITEIVSADNTFDSNEYAILHCNGEMWEIHGSLNIAHGKSHKDVDQIFTTVELPELRKLEELSSGILMHNAAKWWVLDLLQDFKHLELRSGSVTTAVPRQKFLSIVKSELFNFIALTNDTKGRIFGAYILRKLLPFVLIGPYYLLESHDLVLKNDSTTVPFVYKPEEKVSRSQPLKFFINSVLKEMQENNKTLEGLWLYDKMAVDSTCYLEVMTTNVETSLPKHLDRINMEHGYARSSPIRSPSPEAPPEAKRVTEETEDVRRVIIYLYFDVFGLGYIEGTLDPDDSVIINHPIDRNTKVKSQKIGDWFISIIRRKIKFLPKNLVVKWFVTKHKQDLRGRPPFNKRYLEGHHILCSKGVFPLLQLSETKIKELELNKEEVLCAISESQVISEVRELKVLSKLLWGNTSNVLWTPDILEKAVHEIRRQENLTEDLLNEKYVESTLNSELISKYLKALRHYRIQHHIKMRLLDEVARAFVRNGEIGGEFSQKLKRYRFGRIYLKRFAKRRKSEMSRLKRKKDSLPDNRIKSQKLPIKSKTVGNSTEVSNRIAANKTSNQNSSFKPALIEVFENSNTKQPENDLKKVKLKIRSHEKGERILGETSQTNESGNGFVKLTSLKLPKNIKVHDGFTLDENRSPKTEGECQTKPETVSSLKGEPSASDSTRTRPKILRRSCSLLKRKPEKPPSKNFIIIRNLKNSKLKTVEEQKEEPSEKDSNDSEVEIIEEIQRKVD